MQLASTTLSAGLAHMHDNVKRSCLSSSSQHSLQVAAARFGAPHPHPPPHPHTHTLHSAACKGKGGGSSKMELASFAQLLGLFIVALRAGPVMACHFALPSAARGSNEDAPNNNGASTANYAHAPPYANGHSNGHHGPDGNGHSTAHGGNGGNGGWWGGQAPACLLRLCSGLCSGPGLGRAMPGGCGFTCQRHE